MADQPHDVFDFGYYLYPPLHPGDPGHRQLDIILRQNPTQRHFDPEQITLNIASPIGGVEKLIIELPFSGNDHYQVVAGRIIMKDRLGKTTEIFSFGGRLTLTIEQDYTICMLRSAAPILDLLYQDSPAATLAQEVEILLAQRRAAWSNDLGLYEQHLAVVDPLVLYHACLDALREKLKHFPLNETLQLQKFIHLLKVESKSVHQEHHLQGETASLSELL